MIKNMKWMISVILIICGTMTAQAAQDEKNGTPFFTSEDLPNIANFLPAPPESPERGARPNGHQRCRLWDADHHRHLRPDVWP